MQFAQINSIQAVLLPFQSTGQSKFPISWDWWASEPSLTRYHLVADSNNQALYKLGSTRWLLVLFVLKLGFLI